MGRVDDPQELQDYVEAIQEHVGKVRKAAREARDAYERRAAQEYQNTQVRDGARVRDLPELKPGMWVVVKQQRASHFGLKAVGPYKVVRSEGERVLLEGLSGREVW